MSFAPHFYLLEGPDGSGKSTLAEALTARLQQRGKTVHRAHARYRFKKQGIFAYHTAILDRALHSGADAVVLDRLWPSEVVYGHVCRGGSPWPHLGRLMDRILLRAGVSYVACLPDVETCVAAMATRSELYPDRGRQLHQAYLDHSAGRLGYSRPPDFTYDRTQMAADVAAQALVSVLPVAQPAFDGRLTGNLAADLCVMGEAVNPKTRRARWPFHEHGNSSLTLAEALDVVKHREDQTFFCNAPDAKLAVDHLERKLGRPGQPVPRIVALGGKSFDIALDAVGWSGIQVALLEHPQFTRRFASRSNLAYADRLFSAIYDRTITESD